MHSFAVSRLLILPLLALAATGGWGEAAPPVTSPETESAALQTLVQGYHARGAFEGVVIVSRRDQVLLRAGFGYADRARKIPNSPETVYPLCSVTKQFTAVLVMQEVGKKHLDLDAPVVTYLPDFRTDEKGKTITLRHLLTHTSGLPNLDDALPETGGVSGFYAAADPRLTVPANVIRTYLQGALKTTPGDTFSYNNADYVVLAAVLERVTGQAYPALLETRLLKPVGMSRSGLLTGQTGDPHNLARGYALDPSKALVEESPVHRENFGAAGAMYGTPDDMLRWNRALDSDMLLAPDLRKAMFTPNPKLGYVALSTWVYPAPLRGLAHPPLLMERQGAIYGFHHVSVRAPGDGLSVLVFSNTETSELGNIYEQKGLVFDLMRLLYPPDQTNTPAEKAAQ